MKKILIIEDEQAIREVVSDILSFEAFEVINASNGQEGVQLAIEESPDLIICDVIMPQVNGYEVLNQLQQNPVSKNIPFIFLTAKDSKIDMRQGMNLGADDYLTKPFTTQELLEAVNCRLKKHASLEEYAEKYEEAKQKLKYLLTYDPLTQCLNHLSLQKKFNKIISSLTQDRYNHSLPIISISINNIYEIKLAQGDHITNLLLKQIAEQLKQLLEGKGLIARLDGNEFAVILFPVSTNYEVEIMADLIINKVSTHYNFSGVTINVKLNLGIAQYPQDGLALDRLLQRSRKALEYSKMRGRDYQIYEKNLDHYQSPDLLINPKDLQSALNTNQFKLHYQPEFNLTTQTIDGIEALVYWEHPQIGKISPTKFIPLAEQTGLIKPLTKWVLETACQQTKEWQKAGINPLQIGVNFSGALLNQIPEDELCQWILQAMAKNKLNSESICIEFTESIMINQNNLVIKKLEHLKGLGVSLAIDDFGTGYSSFSYLYNFPVDILKIDKSFISHIEKQSHKQKTILDNLISLGKSLNLSVIAEGVETKNQLAYLHERQCDKVQGFLISPALNALDLESYIKILNNSSSYWSISTKIKEKENFFLSDFF